LLKTLRFDSQRALVKKVRNLHYFGQGRYSPKRVQMITKPFAPDLGVQTSTP